MRVKLEERGTKVFENLGLATHPGMFPPRTTRIYVDFHKFKYVHTEDQHNSKIKTKNK